jgi:hypothetical protein
MPTVRDNNGHLISPSDAVLGEAAERATTA